MNNTCTIFPNITSKEPKYITVLQALQRIKTGGKDKSKVLAVRNATNKDEANKLKMHLPSVCFSGTFAKDRKDADLQNHSGYLVLDFDDVIEVEAKKQSLFALDYVAASWISPSGKGVKALVLLADGTKHREHFAALKDLHPEIDKSGINESRVCYESYDPDILIKEQTRPFTKFKIVETYKAKTALASSNETFDKILKWLTNRGDAFRTGERNLFVFKLASACCRFGISQIECQNEVVFSVLRDPSDFSISEAERTIKSAYRANSAHFNTAVFEQETLVTKGTTKEVEFDAAIYDENIRPKDIIFGSDVRDDALKIFRNGHEAASSTYMTEMDEFFKWKKQEITLLSGIGNYGKSTLLKYMLLLKVVNEGVSFAIFAPEDCPAHEFYHELVEIYIGTECIPSNPSCPSEEYYMAVYDFISQHIFFLYPQSIAPTPEYIKERFLEMVIKKKVAGVIIDPFNQMANNYASVGGKIDQYLDFVLADFTRFARDNDVYFVIVAHPNKMMKQADGNYPCPDVFDLAGGAMWNNKMDNILIYHRPKRGSDPADTSCEFHSKKIRRQRIVGKVGMLEFSLSHRSRRFVINNKDYLQISIDTLTAQQKQAEQQEQEEYPF